MALSEEVNDSNTANYLITGPETGHPLPSPRSLQPVASQLQPSHPLCQPIPSSVLTAPAVQASSSPLGPQLPSSQAFPPALHSSLRALATPGAAPALPLLVAPVASQHPPGKVPAPQPGL